MNFIIKIDNREKELIKLLENKEYSFTLENLDIGDIQVIDFLSNEIIIVIERKTLADLSASIKDGRYKEQKERLKHSLKKSCRKIILIEGNDLHTFTLPLSTLNGVIVNTLLRDNMHIHITKNIEETIEFLENILLHLPKYYEDIQKEIVLGEEKEYQGESVCYSTKKDNITTSICFRNMLSQIPGISTSISTVLMEKYDNIDNFIEELSENSNKNKHQIIKIISEIQYGKNNRKIGEKIAEKIFQYIFNESKYSLEKIEVEPKKKPRKTPTKKSLQTKEITEIQQELEQELDQIMILDNNFKKSNKKQTKPKEKQQQNIENINIDHPTQYLFSS